MSMYQIRSVEKKLIPMSGGRAGARARRVVGEHARFKKNLDFNFQLAYYVLT